MSVFNYTLDHNSPYLSYTNNENGGPSTSGWKVWENVAEDNRSYHVASTGSISFQFYGTGVTLLGQTNASYDVTIDNVAHLNSAPQTFSRVNYSVMDLSEGTHYVTLSTNTSKSMFAFDSATVYQTLKTSSEQLTTATYDNKNTSSLMYTGRWTLESTDGVPDASTTTPYHVTSEKGASVSFTFKDGFYVFVHGMTDATHGQYSVDVDGRSTTFNASRTTLISDTLLFSQGGLDSSSLSHTIKITNEENKALALSRISVLGYSSPSSSASPIPSDDSKHGVSPAAIVAPIVCAVIVMILVGLFFLWRRRRRQKHSLAEKGNSLSTHERGLSETVAHDPFASNPPSIIAPTTRAFSAEPQHAPSSLDLTPSEHGERSRPQPTRLHSATDGSGRVIMTWNGGDDPTSESSFDHSHSHFSYITDASPANHTTEIYLPPSPGPSFLPPPQHSSVDYSTAGSRWSAQASESDHPLLYPPSLPGTPSTATFKDSQPLPDDIPMASLKQQRLSSTSTSKRRQLPTPPTATPGSSILIESDAGKLDDASLARLLSLRGSTPHDASIPPPEYIDRRNKEP